MSFVRAYFPWLLTATGVLLYLCLAYLPRTVVDNDLDDSAAGAVVGEEGTEKGEAPFHSLVMDMDARVRVLRWKRRWQEARAEKNIDAWRWADSLAAMYLRYNRLDTVLRYVVALRRVAVPEAQQRAATHLYGAHVLATETDSGLGARLAGQARLQIAHALSLSDTLADPLIDLRVKAALTYLQTETPMKGITSLRELENQYPSSPEVLLALARLSLHTAQYQKAEKRLRKLLQFAPTNTEAMLYLGRCLLEQGKTEEGRRVLVDMKHLPLDDAMHQLIDNMLK